MKQVHRVMVAYDLGASLSVGDITNLVTPAIVLAALTWCAGTATAALLQSLKRWHVDDPPSVLPPISIIVPVRAPAPALPACAGSMASLNYPNFEVILCADDDDFDAVRLTKQIALQYREFRTCSSPVSATANPKAALLDAGIREAQHELLLLSDDNVVSAPRRLQTQLAYWNAGYGLVSTCVLGSAAQNFWGEVDQAFMNGHFARLQCAADSIGLSFATGKSMLVLRADILRSGGIGTIGATGCEDAKLQRRLAAATVKTTLSHDRLLQPIGTRSFREVWHRHLRWAMCRRQYAPLFFVVEALLSTPVASICGGIASTGLGAGFAVGLIATATMLLSIEWAFLGVSCCASGWRYPAAWLAREALTLPLWLAALKPRRTLVWRQRVLPTLT